MGMDILPLLHIKIEFRKAHVFMKLLSCPTRRVTLLASVVNAMWMSE